MLVGSAYIFARYAVLGWEARLFPEEKAKDPNIPPAELLSFAPHFPDEVLSNPVLPLIALENPTLWRQIVSSAQHTKEERVKLRRKNLQQQKLTLRLLLEMVVWMVGILMGLVVLGSRCSPSTYTIRVSPDR